MDIRETVKLRKEKCKKTGIEFDTCIVSTKELEELLNLTDDQQKEIKELTDEYMIQKHLINTDFLKDYINKDKIREKIKWLKKNILENDYASSNDQDIAEYQVDVLEELLEE